MKTHFQLFDFQLLPFENSLATLLHGTAGRQPTERCCTEIQMAFPSLLPLHLSSLSPTAKNCLYSMLQKHDTAIIPVQILSDLPYLYTLQKLPTFHRLSRKCVSFLTMARSVVNIMKLVPSPYHVPETTLVGIIFISVIFLSSDGK
jgi:hypothetical protein